ncbi:MAG: hypothetical protein MI923_25310 [Phycisphaerales bacterium]|nr:hypothetical protein [Phycisphaerales bacterium]
MRITGRLSACCLGLAVTALVLTGCANTHEERVKAWNDFWSVDKKKQRPVAKRERAKRAARKREPAPKSSRPQAQTSKKQETEKVDRGDPQAIEDYANNAQPRRYGDYQPNDHVSKIERQQQPHRASHDHGTMTGGEEVAMGDPGTRGSESSQPTPGDSLEWPDSLENGPVVHTSAESDAGGDIQTWSSESPSDPSTDHASSFNSETVTITSEGQPPVEPLPVVESFADSTSANEPAADSSPVDATSSSSPPFIEADDSTGRVTANDEAAAASIHEAEDHPLETAELSDLAPSLAEVNISAGPEPVEPESTLPETVEITTDTAKANETPAPVEPVDTFAIHLKTQEELVAKDPNNVEEQYRLRMMYLINGQDEKALAPAEGVDADIQEIIQAQIKALIDARSSTGRDSAAWANRQLESVEELRRRMRSRADLAVPKVTLCTAIEGFGRYDPIEPTEFPAGRKNLVLVYIEVDNFSSEQTTSGLFRTLLSVRQELFNKAGESLWNKKDENIEDLARQKRRDFYLTIGPIAIPKTLPPGEYSLKIEVEDVLAGKLNSRAAKFTIVP